MLETLQQLFALRLGRIGFLLAVIFFLFPLVGTGEPVKNNNFDEAVPIKSDTGGVQAQERKRRYDIYLSEGRICYQCVAQSVNEDNARLIDRQGHWTIIPTREVLGYDKHPVVRKLMIKSLYGIGKAGPDLVPYAFENVKDYVCKYCGSLD